MAVILEKFNIPINCDNCHMFDGECCYITGTPCEDEKSYRNDDCPLKEVPDEPFYEQMVKYCNEHFLVLVEKDVWDDAEKALKEVPSGKCIDCKWWKESDGTYKRGVSAESKCPINTKTVYLGEGYCYKFEPKTDRPITNTDKLEKENK